MKMRKIILGLGILALCASCDNMADKESQGDLAINAYIANKSTRAEKLAWQENDAIGVFVCSATIDKPYLDNSERYTNVLFRHNGKGFTALNIYLDENAAEVFAYYPYSATSKNGQAIPVESNTQTDYLSGQAETPASISQKNVNIEMKHALSQVVFKLRKSASYNEGAGMLSSVKIENNDASNVFKTTGNLDVSSGVVTGTSNNGVLTLMPGEQLLLTDSYQNISSICLPVSATAGKNIRAVFVIDGRQFRYEFPVGTVWKSGLRNIYTLTVENSGLEIGGGGTGDGDGGSDNGITVEGWGDNADSDISLVPIL